MAGKKKKKPAANPARGFATVSQPSKSKEPAPSDDEVLSQEQKAPIGSLSIDPSRSRDPEKTNGEGTEDESKAIEKMSPEELEAHLEDTELQNLVEQHAVRLKSDVTRQVTKLKNERRQLRQQADRASVSGLTDDLIENILCNASQAQHRVIKASAFSTIPETDENEILLKLWLLQEVLMQLKIPSVDEVLASVLRTWRQQGIEVAQSSVWGLHEALVWYAGVGGAEESPVYDLDQTAEADRESQIVSIDDNQDSEFNISSL